MKDEDIVLPEFEDHGLGDYLCRTKALVELFARESVRLNISKKKSPHDREIAACNTLERMGYTHNGGTEWKPPLGTTDFANDQRLPFDPEKAKAGRPLVARDGRNARFVAYIPEAIEYPVVVYIDGDRSTSTITMGGRYISGGPESVRDLFLSPPKKRTVWLNFYDGESPAQHDSEEAAKRSAGKVAILVAHPVNLPVKG